MAPKLKKLPEEGDGAKVARILDAAFALFVKKGYAATSTLDIATCAHVSKRELYALIGNKQAMLTACIAERARRLQAPVDLPEPHDRKTLMDILSVFGARFMTEVSDPAVIAMFRLAIAEVIHAPEVARTLDTVGRGTSRATLREIMLKAKEFRVISGDPVMLAEQFSGLLWQNLLVSLLLGVAERPTQDEIKGRVREAVAVFLQLHASSAS